MFFFPWATGVIIMVLCCIVGVACLRLLPVWGGAVVGVGLYYLWETLIQMNDYVSFWVFLPFVPGILFGLIALYMSSKHDKEEEKIGFWGAVFSTALGVLLTFPITAIITNWVLGEFFNPNEHRFATINRAADPAIVEQQLAALDIKFNSFMEARQMLSDITDCGLCLYLGLAVLWFIFDCMKDRPNGKTQKTTHI